MRERIQRRSETRNRIKLGLGELPNYLTCDGVNREMGMWECIAGRPWPAMWRYECPGWVMALTFGARPAR